MLSGRYRTEGLCRFWSPNQRGLCLLPSCADKQIKEDIQHLLTSCPSLNHSRRTLVSHFREYSRRQPNLAEIINSFLTSPDRDYCVQFLLDCSTIPSVILLRQAEGLHAVGQLFYLTRTWCYTLHRDRLRQLGRWNPS